MSYKNKLTYVNKVNKIALMKEDAINEEKAEPLRDLVGKIDRMLRALNNEQRIVIETYYFYEQRWDYVAKTYMKVYNNPKTIKQLQNIRDKAFDKMLEVINV